MICQSSATMIPQRSCLDTLSLRAGPWRCAQSAVCSRWKPASCRILPCQRQNRTNIHRRSHDRERRYHRTGHARQQNAGKAQYLAVVGRSSCHQQRQLATQAAPVRSSSVHWLCPHSPTRIQRQSLTWEVVPRDYLPLHWGLRFSMKARGPSRLSSEFAIALYFFNSLGGFLTAAKPSFGERCAV